MLCYNYEPVEIYYICMNRVSYEMYLVSYPKVIKYQIVNITIRIEYRPKTTLEELYIILHDYRVGFRKYTPLVISNCIDYIL